MLASAPVAAAEALKDLVEISSQVRNAVVFGPDGSVEVVDVGDESELLVHDAHHAEPSAAFALTRLTQSTVGATPVGVLRDVERPVYDELMAEQLDAASRVREGGGAVNQLEVATAEGSVFVVRDAERAIAATTSPDPTVGLVFYDLKSCLRDAAQKPEPKRTSTRKKKSDGA